MRSMLGVCALFLCLAAPARAGIIGLPLQDETICGDFNVAATMIAAGSYAGAPKCPSLCRAASAQCHRFVARITACHSAFQGTEASFETRNCNTIANPTDRAACRGSVKSSLANARDTLAGSRDAAFLGCETWQSDCEAACP